MMTIDHDPDLADAARDALAVRGIVAHPLVRLAGYPRILSDLTSVAVKLRSSYDDAWDEIYWLRILGDGGVPVAPLLAHGVVPILDHFGVATQYLAPDRDTDARDAPATAQVLRQVHDIAFEYLEADGTVLVPLPSGFVLSQGVLHLGGINGVERHTRECARLRAADGFVSGLREDVRAQFLDAYDG